VDFKVSPVKQLEDGSWEYAETMQDPETIGYYKVSVEGDKLDMFATAPKKWCHKFVKEADGSWKCTNDGMPEPMTAVATDIKPAPSKFGAGGLPKGQVNLGSEEDNEGFNALW
jgi:hypothetical protein